MSNNKATTILDRPFGDVLSERITELPEEERVKLLYGDRQWRAKR